MTDAYDQYCAEAGQEDDRGFHELMEELEAANKDERKDAVFESLRYLFNHVSQQRKDWVTEKLRG